MMLKSLILGLSIVMMAECAYAEESPEYLGDALIVNLVREKPTSAECISALDKGDYVARFFRYNGFVYRLLWNTHKNLNDIPIYKNFECYKYRFKANTDIKKSKFSQ